MFDLDELYQEIILDHNRRPRNFGPLESATHDAEGHNPLCGDEVKIHLRVQDDKVAEIRFEGQGCAISQSSASLMTEALLGRPVEEARAIYAKMMILLTEGEPSDPEASPADNGPADPGSTSDPSPGAESIEFEDELEALGVFAGVRDYPSRVKCASLAWHAFDEALARGQQVD